MMMETKKIKVKTGIGWTENFHVHTGLKQDDTLFATVFNIYLQQTLRNIDTHETLIWWHYHNKKKKRDDKICWGDCKRRGKDRITQKCGEK